MNHGDALIDRTGYRLAHLELRQRMRWLAARVAAEEWQPGGITDEARVEVARGLADALVMMDEELERMGAARAPEPSLRRLLRGWIVRRLSR